MTKETAKKTTITAKPAEPAKKSGTAAKTEPVKKAEVKKTEPAKSTEAKKTEPAKKVEVKKTEPVKKAEPAKKTEAAKKAEPAKKTEAVKKAEPAKKTEPVKKAEPAKKQAAAKKTATAKKAEVKTNFVIQSYGKEISEKEIVALGKKAWAAAGNKIREIKTLTAYVQPENGKVYFVINGIALEGDGSDF